MNLFKILANGHGSINEPNVSAFLGFLLDPYEDHGLGHEFLDRIINNIKFQNIEKGEFNTYKYDYVILLEQAFRDENKTIKNKQIVDIVILCYENSKGSKKELQAKSIIEITRELKYIFLIENKINIHSITKGQLKNQYDNTLNSVEKGNSEVISIYITPKHEKFTREFGDFNVNLNQKQHLFWMSDTEKNHAIYSILKDIISDEAKGDIEAINEYTKHTLISFIKFIENDFKSQVIEKKENKFKKDIFDNLEKYLEKYKNEFNEGTIKHIKDIREALINRDEITLRHSITHPLSAFYNGSKIFSLTKSGMNCIYHFINNNEEKLKPFIDYLESSDLECKNHKRGYKITQQLETKQAIELFNKYLNEVVLLE